MTRLDRVHWYLFDLLLAMHDDDLIAHYGDEIRFVFRDEMGRARLEEASEMLGVWMVAIRELVMLSAPKCFARVQLVFAATALASSLVFGSALGFCSLHASSVVHACAKPQVAGEKQSPQSLNSSTVLLPDGRHMFLECAGKAGTKPTVVLVTGRGLGTADAWRKVQDDIPSSIRVCSYDAMGVGKSDPIQGSPQARPISQVVADMHALFEAGSLSRPYVLVGASGWCTLSSEVPGDISSGCSRSRVRGLVP